MGHPNVRVFISHGGQLSTIESVHCGVPMVVIPVYGDQPVNAGAVAAAGMALRLDYHTLTKKRLLERLHAVLNNTERRSRVLGHWIVCISTLFNLISHATRSAWLSPGLRERSTLFSTLKTSSSAIIELGEIPTLTSGLCYCVTLIMSDHPEDLADATPGVVVAQTTTGVTVSLTTVSSTDQPTVYTIGSLMDTLGGTMWREGGSLYRCLLHTPMQWRIRSPIRAASLPGFVGGFKLICSIDTLLPTEVGLQGTMSGSEVEMGFIPSLKVDTCNTSDSGNCDWAGEEGKSTSKCPGVFEFQQPRLPNKTKKRKKVVSPPLSPLSPVQQGGKDHIMTTSSIVSTGGGVQIAASDGSLPPVWWMTQLSVKEPNGGPERMFPLFLVTLVSRSEVAQLSKETSLNHFKITMESYHRWSIPQCHNCQRFGHSSPTCGALPRCIRCEVGHHTQDCELYADISENVIAPGQRMGCSALSRLPTEPSAPRPTGRPGQAQHPFSDQVSFPVLPSVEDIPGFTPVTPVTQSSSTSHLRLFINYRSEVSFVVSTSPGPDLKSCWHSAPGGPFPRGRFHLVGGASLESDVEGEALADCFKAWFRSHYIVPSSEGHSSLPSSPSLPPIPTDPQTDIFLVTTVELHEVPFIFVLPQVLVLTKQVCPLTSSYHPISLPSCMIKVAEDNRFLPDHHFGLRTRHSSTHALAWVVDQITDGFSKRVHTGLVALDVQSAFDSVSHPDLLLKLLSVILSILLGLTFQVCLNAVLSSSRPILAGAQESLLFPLLYSWFVHDIPLPLGCSLPLYTDDTALMAQSIDVRVLLGKVSCALRSLALYASWGLLLNLAKIQDIIFTRHHPGHFLPLLFGGRSFFLGKTPFTIWGSSLRGCLVESCPTPSLLCNLRTLVSFPTVVFVLSLVFLPDPVTLRYTLGRDCHLSISFCTSGPIDYFVNSETQTILLSEPLVPIPGILLTLTAAYATSYNSPHQLSWSFSGPKNYLAPTACCKAVWIASIKEPINQSACHASPQSALLTCTLSEPHKPSRTSANHTDCADTRQRNSTVPANPVSVRTSPFFQIRFSMDVFILQKQEPRGAVADWFKNSGYQETKGGPPTTTRFRESAKQVSRAFQDRPMLPMDTAIYWTEYIVRHRGAPLLHFAGADLSLHQYLLLDVVAVLAVFAVIVNLIVFVVVKKLVFLLGSVSQKVFRERVKGVPSSVQELTKTFVENIHNITAPSRHCRYICSIKPCVVSGVAGAPVERAHARTLRPRTSQVSYRNIPARYSKYGRLLSWARPTKYTNKRVELQERTASKKRK
uniref:UDP-glycosyltransferase n=1 Tax=Timema douglasi TaxID=61478 RepID=A0A7R8VS47_TIMDO|nr:unnamed protein product [Timema douglasi]